MATHDDSSQDQNNQAPRRSKIMELKGSLKNPPNQPINIDRIRDYIDYSDL